MSQAALDAFGRLLMAKVRDEAISDWRMIVEGQMKGELSVKVREKLTVFSETQRDVFLSLLPEIVDTVLHHLLWTLEQAEDVDVAVRADGVSVRSIRDASDGLAGELYSDEGWIARFSKEKG